MAGEPIGQHKAARQNHIRLTLLGAEITSRFCLRYALTRTLTRQRDDEKRTIDEEMIQGRDDVMKFADRLVNPIQPFHVAMLPPMN